MKACTTWSANNFFFSRSFSPSNRYADSLPTFSLRSLGARGGGGEDFTPFFSPRDKAERNGKERKGKETSSTYCWPVVSLSIYLRIHYLASQTPPSSSPPFKCISTSRETKIPFPSASFFLPRNSIWLTGHLNARTSMRALRTLLRAGN